MLWAGPIEFSTGEIIAILLVMVALALAIPVAAGVVAVVLYRKRTPPEARTSREAWILFFKTFSLALLAQIVVGAVIGFIHELIE